jgi:hypothetical protein
MRALLGLLVLGGLFLAAATWQGRTTERLRDQRSREYGVPDADNRREVRAGWSELVLGRPSGAQPLARPASMPGPASDPGSASEVDPNAPKPRPEIVRVEEPRYAPDFEYVVRSSDVLGVICQKHYGKGRLREIVPAVAKYNDLSSADGIVAGKVLLLPDVRLLLGE